MPTIHEGTSDASGLHLAVVASRFNSFVTDRLLSGALSAIRGHGGRDEDVEVFKVPGAWELPQAAQRVARAVRFDGIVTVGCLLRGDTLHYELLANEVATGLARVALDTGMPLSFGVLACDTVDQAMERAGDGEGNKGFEAAVACIELVHLTRLLR